MMPIILLLLVAGLWASAACRRPETGPPPAKTPADQSEHTLKRSGDHREVEKVETLGFS